MENKPMPDPDLRIVFMGTPVFAVESLKAVIEAGYQVVGVVTAPDKPSGRGQIIKPSPVKQFAQQHNLPVLQPVKLKDPDFIEKLRNFKANLQVVVAFRILPEEVWKMPELGTFNLHASLLPDYRGAAPINWAIMNGETKTGVTTFFITHEIDAGSILLREETQIHHNETAGELHDRLMKKGASLVVKTIALIGSGQVQAVDQSKYSDSRIFNIAPKIQKSDCRIIWNNKTRNLYNFIRGLSPIPGAWTEIENEKKTRQVVKIYFAEELHHPHHKDPGSIETDNRSYLHITTLNGYLNVKSLQLQGKKKLEISEFLRGFPQIGSCRFL